MGLIAALGLGAYLWGSFAPYVDWKIPADIGRACASYVHGDYSMWGTLSVLAAGLVGGGGGAIAAVWSAVKVSRRAAVACAFATVAWVAGLIVGYATHAPYCVNV